MMDQLQRWLEKMHGTTWATYDKTRLEYFIRAYEAYLSSEEDNLPVHEIPTLEEFIRSWYALAQKARPTLEWID